MITRDKLAIYSKYRGDCDMFALAGSWAEKQRASESDFFEIEEIIGALTIVLNGVASPEYAERTRAKLAACCPDEQARVELEQMARQEDA